MTIHNRRCGKQLHRCVFALGAAKPLWRHVWPGPAGLSFPSTNLQGWVLVGRFLTSALRNGTMAYSKGSCCQAPIRRFLSSSSQQLHQSPPILLVIGPESVFNRMRLTHGPYFAPLGKTRGLGQFYGLCQNLKGWQGHLLFSFGTV